MKFSIALRTALSLAVIACAGTDTTAPRTAQTVSIAANIPDTLEPGNAANLQAFVIGDDGKLFTDGVVIWGSSDPAVAIVASTGARTAKLTAVGAGETKISATLAGRSSTATVTIAPTGASAGTEAAFIYSEQGGMSFIPLPKDADPISDGISAEAVNDLGQVVGAISYVNDNFANCCTSHAFIWSQADGMTDLGVLPGSSWSTATAISRDGQVAGYSVVDGNTHAFRWTRATGMVDLGVPLGSYSSNATGINSAGEVVGESLGPDGVHAFRWTEERGMENLSASATELFAQATAINEAGQVAGWLSLPGDPNWFDGNVATGAIFWTASGIKMDIVKCSTMLGSACGASALAINGNGVVVGTDGTHAFTWTSDGGIQVLSGLPSGTYTEATGINDKGNVVGNVYEPENGVFPWSAFLWSAAKGYRKLPPPGGRKLIHLQAINNNDQIVGYVR